METDAPSPILPELDERDIIALEVLLTRVVRAQDQAVVDREQIKFLNERIARCASVRDTAYDALKVFGFAEPPEDDRNIWDLVRQAIGVDRYARAVAVARGAEFPALLTQMGDDEAPAETRSRQKPPVAIRTAILEYLLSRGDRGAKVGEVKQHLSSAYGITVHEKTPGMTLYRLLKDGLARRDGRTWFAEVKDETNENEAPAASPHGASDAGGVAAPPNDSPPTLEELMS